MKIGQERLSRFDIGWCFTVNEAKSTVKEKIIGFIKWVKSECKDWKTFVILLFVMAIIYSPVWLGFLLYALFMWKGALAIATIMLAFWAGPFTPFFPICIAITLFIKKLIEHK